MPKSGNATWKMLEAEIQIRISPMPPGLISTWTRDQLVEELKKTVESSVGNVTGGQKVYDKEIKQGELIGREIKVRAQGTDIIARLFYTNDRLYMLAAMLTTEPDAEALVKKVFDTFEITKE